MLCEWKTLCRGAYHEAAIILNVEHIASGKRAVHCPWMLVDSDRALVAGREQTGFPKMIGRFNFTVTTSTDGGGTRQYDVSDPAAGLLMKYEDDVDNDDDDDDAARKKIEKQKENTSSSPVLFPGATVSAEVWRGGTRLLSMSGRLSGEDLGSTRKDGGGDEKKDDGDGFQAGPPPGRRYVFLNVQTLHPMPPDEDDDSVHDPNKKMKTGRRGESDGMCLGNRPRLVQFIIDEVPTKNVWPIVDPVIVLEQTKTDAIGLPFGIPFDEEGGSWPLEVVNMTFGVTNLYTGEEEMARLGERVPAGYLENDLIYWLRNQ